MNDTVIVFCAFSFVCRDQLWADSLGVLYSAQVIKHLSWKVVCSHHFSESDFTSPECIRLNRIVVPTFCATLSYSHSAPKPTELTLSQLVVCPDYLPVQKQIKTYSKLSITASKAFQVQNPPFPLAVFTNMLVVENSGVSAFKVLPQSAKPGIPY